jgi:hypothetical protein
MLYQVRKREIRAAILTRNGCRQVQAPGRFAMIRGEGLRQSEGPILHVADCDLRGGRQGSEKRLQFGQLEAEAGRPRGIVQQDEELHIRHVAGQAPQADYGRRSVPLQNRQAAGFQARRGTAWGGKRGDYHLLGNACSIGGGSRNPRAGSHKRHRKHTDRSARFNLHLVVPPLLSWMPSGSFRFLRASERPALTFPTAAGYHRYVHGVFSKSRARHRLALQRSGLRQPPWPASIAATSAPRAATSCRRSWTPVPVPPERLKRDLARAARMSNGKLDASGVWRFREFLPGDAGRGRGHALRGQCPADPRARKRRPTRGWSASGSSTSDGTPPGRSKTWG